MSLLAALAVALSPVLLGWFLNRQLKAIHVLVNSRLTEALEEIQRLKSLLGSSGAGPPRY